MKEKIKEVEHVDCNRAREIMWDEPQNEELLEHIASCPECKSEYELINKTKSALSSKDETSGIMARIRKEEHRRKISKITKFAAVAVLALAVGIFGKLALDSGLKRAEKADDADCVFEAESTTDGYTGTTDNGDFKDFEYSKPMEPSSPPSASPMNPEPESAVSDDAVSNKYTEYPSEEEPEAPVEREEEALESETSQIVRDEADTIWLFGNYKADNNIPSHTADVIVSGDDISGVAQLLCDYGAYVQSSHVVIDKDVYSEVQKLLSEAGFEILTATSSENVLKTVIYFKELLY